MAEDDTERLIVQLEAKIDQFEKNLAKASRSADQNFRSMETRAKQAADSMQAQMAKAAQGIAGVFTGFGNNFLSAAGISGLGLTALIASAVKLNSELARIPGLAREAGLSTDRLQEVQFATRIKGLGDEEFVAGMRTSLGLLSEAQRQVNTLSRLMNANNMSIRDSNGDLIKFDQLLEIAARLMVGARTEQEKIRIAEMLGLSREWVAVLRDGPETFRQSAAEAHNAGAVIDAATVQKARDFDRAWSQAIVRFKAGFTEAFTDLTSAFSDFWEGVVDSIPGASFLSRVLDRWAGGLRGMTMPELEETLKRSVEAGLGQFEIDRIQAEIDRRLGRQPLRVSVTPEVATPTVVPRDVQRNVFDRAIYEAQRRIAETEAETATIGQNTEARERARLVAQLEEAAKRANTEAGFQNATVTDAQREKINQLADAMEAAARRQRESHSQLLSFARDGMDAVKQIDQLAVSSFSNLENAFAGFVTGTKTAKDAFHDMAIAILADLTRMIVRMQVTAPLARAIGGAFGGGASSAGISTGTVAAGGQGIVGVAPFAVGHSGGLATELSGRRWASVDDFIGAPRFHDGKEPWDSSSEMPAIIRKDEEVITRADPRHILNGGGGGAPPINLSIQIDARGADTAGLNSAVDRLRGELPGIVIKTVQQARSRRIL